MADSRAVRDSCVETTVKAGSIEQLQCARHLCVAHAREMEPHRADDAVEPSWDRYLAAERAGLLAVALAWGRVTFEGDEPPLPDVVGYAVAAVVESMHYADLKFAQVDGIYVDPAWRRSGLGGRLLAELTQQARRLDARELLIHAKPNTPLATMMLRRHEIDGIWFRKEL